MTNLFILKGNSLHKEVHKKLLELDKLDRIALDLISKGELNSSKYMYPSFASIGSFALDNINRCLPKDLNSIKNTKIEKFAVKIVVENRIFLQHIVRNAIKELSKIRRQIMKLKLKEDSEIVLDEVERLVLHLKFMIMRFDIYEKYDRKFKCKRYVSGWFV